MNLIHQSVDFVMTIFGGRHLFRRQDIMHLDGRRLSRRIFFGVQRILFRCQGVELRLIYLAWREHERFKPIMKIVLLPVQGLHVFVTFLEDLLDRIFLLGRQIDALKKGKSTRSTTMRTHGRLGMGLSHGQCTNSHSSNQKRTT